MAAPADTRLTLWTLYEDPVDYPGRWVIRAHYLLADGTSHADLETCFVGATREDVTRQLEHIRPGLHWLGRNADDELQIVGVWV